MLQVGCGTRLFNKSLPSNLHIDNLDINKKHLEYGLKKGRFKNYMLGSVYSIPCEKETYDTVLLARCFHHLKKQKKALLECSRVLKIDGKIIIYDPVSDKKEDYNTRYINTEYDGMIYDYHISSFPEYIKSILPSDMKVEKMKFKKSFTATNYNFRYPHTDAYAVLRKQY